MQTYDEEGIDSLLFCSGVSGNLPNVPDIWNMQNLRFQINSKMQSVKFIHLSKCQSSFSMNSLTLQCFYGPSSSLTSIPSVFLLVYIREEMRKTVLLSLGSQLLECCDPKSKSINHHRMSYLTE